jgi:flagellar biosynthesis protein FlhG
MHAAECPHDEPPRRARTVLVAGGKGGVGTTSVAVNLAVATAQKGNRTVLVDGDPDGPDVQTLCRLRGRYTISDVLAGRRTLGEALQSGPGGVLILPGAWAAADLVDASDRCQVRLLDQLKGLASRADLIVIDGGNGMHRFTRRLWQACGELVLVSSTDTNAVLDTYAALKVALDPARRPRIHLLVNRCEGPDEAGEVHGRINRSCQRFLGFSLPPCHWMLADPAIATAGQQGVPFVLSHSDIGATETLRTLTQTFGDVSNAHSGEGSEAPHDKQIDTTNSNLPDRLNPGGENADSEEDRSLFARC